jgi:thiamine biosynthesis protein ThiS
LRAAAQETSAAVTETTLPILVNGESREIAPGLTVADLLGSLGLADRRVAVAVNRAVVPRSTHAARALASGDRVEILEAVGGG